MTRDATLHITHLRGADATHPILARVRVELANMAPRELIVPLERYDADRAPWIAVQRTWLYGTAGRPDYSLWSEIRDWDIHPYEILDLEEALDVWWIDDMPDNDLPPGKWIEMELSI